MRHRLRLLARIAVPLAVLAASAGPAGAQYFAYGKNRVQYQTHDWYSVQTAHFDVFFYERDPSAARPVGTAPGGRVLAEFAAEAAEEAYREVSALFGTDVARRIPLLVYPTHAEFAVTNAVELPVYAEGIGGVTELFKNRIAIPFTGDWRDFRRVVHHELVHAVVNDLYYGGSVAALVRGGGRLQIPAWFNEGLAEFSAQGWDTQSDLYVREAILNGRLPEIRRLSGFFAYRGGQGVWDWVAQEYGREKVTEILDRVRLGRSVGAAFQRATGLGLGELSDRWHRTLRAVYFPEVAAREETEDAGRIIAGRGAGETGYHASPALSPQGDRVAYVATDDGLFDVYVATTVGRPHVRKIIDGQDNAQFESLRLLTPGLSWSPDGQRLAVAVTSGPGDAIALVDPETGDVQTVRPPGIDAVVSVTWSPDGRRIAFEGTAGAHSDLYLLDLATGDVTNLTRDLYSDHAPAWSPDGTALVFHSDRGDALALAQATAQAAFDGRFDSRQLGRTPFSLYRLDLDTPNRVTRLTAASVWDDTDAALAAAPGGGERLLFVSDRNGIPNLYALDPDSAGTAAGTASGTVPEARPLTNLQTGVLDVSLSADGGRAAALVLHDGIPSVVSIRDPFGRDGLPAELAPTVWAQRRTGERRAAPALQLASQATREANPILRDAADGRPAPRPPRRAAPPTAEQLAFADSILQALGPPRDLVASTDTVDLGRGPAVDFRDYEFSEAFEEGQRPRLGASDPFRPALSRDSTGALVARPYKLRFSLDLIFADGGYDTVYGLQSITQIRFSDMLGNHRVGLSTNLVLDLRNADYVLGYEYRPHRTDVRVEGFHLARQLASASEKTVYRYRNYGLVAGARYPLDKFRRVDAEVGLLGVSLADLSDIGERARTRAFVVPRVTYTDDRTVPGFLGPRSGTRWAASLSAAPGPDAFFVTALADGRAYRPLGPGYALAVRGSAGISVGRDPQRFYAAGVQNWVNPDLGSLPVQGPDDFIFATPVLPVRGFGYNEAAGDRFALVNVEARVPLIAALLPGPVPLLPLYDIQAVGFVDAGVIAQGGVDLWRTVAVDDDGDPATPEVERRVLDDVLLGAGVGLRTVVLGFPVRADWAWPFDGRGFGDPNLYFSVGLDF